MFVNGDRVKFHSTGDTELDMITGKVIGKFAEDAYGSHYIVLLDSRHSKSEWDATAITQHCLTKI